MPYGHIGRTIPVLHCYHQHHCSDRSDSDEKEVTAEPLKPDGYFVHDEELTVTGSAFFFVYCTMT
jgi:hypothetical protein